MKLFVEGGGDRHALKAECRNAFTSFLKKAGFSGKMPRVVACGSRIKAFESYTDEIAAGGKAFLLVDSEAAVEDIYQKGDILNWNPWAHLLSRDGWIKPTNAKDIDCHLMVQIMETWFIADIDTLVNYFGQNFNRNALSKKNLIELIPKKDIYSALALATKATNKGVYSKGEHSFQLLRLIDPKKVKSLSPWARRFLELLEKSI
ncbi:MAG: DUF4276 family protein [Clostridiales bacterium]|nr:DUF4276 family protein [Clostridiales bacterium]